MKIKTIVTSLVACTLTPFTMTTQAQEENGSNGSIEEIIVTGSHIRRDKFEMASPIETIDPETILNSGQTTIGGLVRSLPYTQNVDTVANVIDSADGIQESNGARFNLRGLGTSSTLTLMDGRRAIDPDSIASILPELAIANIDILLDGGAATYGTDAIAGVVNFVPLQSYDGFKIRGFHTQDEEGDSPESKISLLWGKSWEKVDIVTALDYSERKDGLYRSDRPKYLRADNDTSVFGGPGVYATYVPGHGTGNPFSSVSTPFGTFPGAAGVDPACGTFNGTNTDDGLAGSYPSGYYDESIKVPLGSGVTGNLDTCRWEYGEFNDYKRPNDYLVFYTSATYEMTDKVALKAIVNLAERSSTLLSSPTTGTPGSNNLLLIPADHPNNPFGVDVSPYSSFWRPFTGKLGSTQPSILDSRGSYTPEFTWTTYQVNLGTEFEIGDSGWYGEVWAVTGNETTHADGANLNIDRLQKALRGEGGVNGNQWWNPFGSSSRFAQPVDGRSNTGFGNCEPGMGVDPNNGLTCSNNDQALVDWLFVPADQDYREEDYWSIEGFVSGDIFELPSGPLAMAVGGQVRYRDYSELPIAAQSTFPSTEFPTAGPLGTPAGQDYSTPPNNGVGGETYGESEVRSLFAEFDVPLLDNLDMIVAARYEDFRDFRLSTTAPKVSFRWEALDNLVFRASWGEGFLAPTIRQATVTSTPACTEVFSGNDKLTGNDLTGAISCFNGNPDLGPEDSTLTNIGLTWRATENLEFSIDYQTIKYNDRIVELETQDIVDLDYANFLAAGLDPASAADRAAWYGSGQDPRIIRNADESVRQVTRGGENVNDMDIEIVDLRVLYTMDFGDWGYASAQLTSTIYPKYAYLDAETGQFVDGAGKQNGETGVAPPLPKYKNTLNLGWVLDSHSLAITVNNHGSVDFDAIVGPTAGPDPVQPSDIPQQIHAYTTVDMRYAYTFENFWDGTLELGVGSTNITDNEAQALPVPGGLETRLQDPTGRTFYLEATYSF